MLIVHFDGMYPRIPCMCISASSGVNISEVLRMVESKYYIPDGVYFTYDGKKVSSDVSFVQGVLHISLGLMGGKGGFGSMLRAIGAQIEKTTNREACRDLSGRRLRDINEEKRLKNWIALKADREREATERKRKKLEKLRSEPKHDFSDKHYEEERSNLVSEISDAVEKGFEVAASNQGPNTSTSRMKKGFMFEDEELSGSSLSDSDDDSCSASAVSHQATKRKAESNSEAGPSKKLNVSSSVSSSSDSS